MSGQSDAHEGAAPQGPRSVRIAGASLLVAGLALGAEASTFEVAFLMDPVGPKAMPYLVAAILTAAGLRLMLRADRAVQWPPASVLRRMAAAAAAFLVYAGALPFVGFFLSTTAVVAVLAMLYGAPRRWAILTAGLLAGALWMLFVVVLGLPLPVGDLWMR